MNVLVIGSGGREHALVWKIRQSPRIRKAYCAPGNPGIGTLAECVPLEAMNLEGLLRFAQEAAIDLTVVGPEQPLAAGIVDAFKEAGLRIFGPTKKAAELEWSKAFAKSFMHRHGIPTAGYRAFTSGQRSEAESMLMSANFPVVLKADGLAAGKGVIVCNDTHQALAALQEMMGTKTFGSASETVVVEEFMRGEEASVFAICDGTRFVTLAPAQDHKRALDDDQGKNTGGMGAYAPAPVVTADVMRNVQTRIIGPTLKGMAVEGRPYHGCLYVGLMVTEDGPKVVEYNSRFGDPETQVVLPLFSGDLVELMLAACDGTLVEGETRLTSGSAVSVVLASGGYPESYQAGKPIRGLENVPDGVVVFHAGTRKSDGNLVTAGGRVLDVTAISGENDIEQTIHTAYEAVRRIGFEGMHYRRDIGRKALHRQVQSSS
jgi:phosphoribosylamine--glycine ligase